MLLCHFSSVRWNWIFFHDTLDLLSRFASEPQHSGWKSTAQFSGSSSGCVSFRVTLISCWRYKSECVCPSHDPSWSRCLNQTWSSPRTLLRWAFPLFARIRSITLVSRVFVHCLAAAVGAIFNWRTALLGQMCQLWHWTRSWGTCLTMLSDHCATVMRWQCVQQWQSRVLKVSLGLNSQHSLLLCLVVHYVHTIPHWHVHVSFVFVSVPAPLLDACFHLWMSIISISDERSL